MWLNGEQPERWPSIACNTGFHSQRNYEFVFTSPCSNQFSGSFQPQIERLRTSGLCLRKYETFKPIWTEHRGLVVGKIISYCTGHVFKSRPRDRLPDATRRFPQSLEDKAGESMARCIQCSLEFFCPTSIYTLWIICVYYTYLTAYRLYVNYRCYQITLRVKHFYTNQEHHEVLTGSLSLGCLRGGEWSNTWHWTKRFYNVILEYEVVQLQLLPQFLPYRIPRGNY
jgi:hypothetical protein